MVKRSSTATLSSVISAGPEDIARKVGVASSNTFQVSDADLFPLVPKDDTISHPIYMVGRDRDLSGPIRDVPKVSTCPKSHPELLDVYLHYCCHGQDNHVCVYCSQNHLVAHIDSIL